MDVHRNGAAKLPRQARARGTAGPIYDGVIQHRLAALTLLDGQQQRIAMLGPQLVSLGPVVGQRRPAGHLAAGEQDIDARIDQDGHVGRIDGPQGRLLDRCLLRRSPTARLPPPRRLLKKRGRRRARPKAGTKPPGAPIFHGLAAELDMQVDCFFDAYAQASDTLDSGALAGLFAEVLSRRRRDRRDGGAPARV
jgi:hypothetical protein